MVLLISLNITETDLKNDKRLQTLFKTSVREITRKNREMDKTGLLKLVEDAGKPILMMAEQFSLQTRLSLLIEKNGNAHTSHHAEISSATESPALLQKTPYRYRGFKELQKGDSRPECKTRLYQIPQIRGHMLRLRRFFN